MISSRFTGAAVRVRAHGSALLLAAVLSACAAVPPVRISDADFPPARELDHTPFFPQEDYQCGPAALATVLNAAGVTVSPQELLPQVYLPERKGSLQLELIAATRRAQRVPYVLAPDTDALVREIAAGHPVLVFQNLGLSWAPLWHYAVVVGYDLERQELVLRSGRERRHILPVSTFERTWARGQRWALLVAPLDQLPATAESHAYVAAVAQLERLNLHDVAVRAYDAAIRRWPDDINARFGLGNSYHALGKLVEAETAFRAVVERDADHAAGWNNLAQTLLDQQRWDEAEAAARTALALGGPGASVARQTLDEIRAARAAEQR